MSATEKAKLARRRFGWVKIFGEKPDACSYGKYVTKTSPSRKLILAFDPGGEYSMMRYSYSFRLIDREGNVLEKFFGLSSPVQSARWSPDSRFAGVPTDEGLLLLNADRRMFSAVRFDPYNERARLTNSSVVIKADPAAWRSAFGTRFKPPRPSSIRFSALAWEPVPEKWNLGPAVRRAPRIYWVPSGELRAYAKKNRIKLLGVKP